MRREKRMPVAPTTSTQFDYCAEAQQPLISTKNTVQEDILQGCISVFPSVIETIPSESIKLSEGLERIQSGAYRSLIERMRPIAEEAHQAWQGRKGRGEKSAVEKQYESLKRTLPAVTWSGEFTVRRTDGLLKHSGILCADIDHLGQDDVRELRETLIADPHVSFLFRSPGNHGLKVGLRIEPEHHREAWEAIDHYFRDCYGFEIDPTGKDVSRLCFFSYDPDLYVNDRAQLFTCSASLSEARQERKNKKERSEVEQILSFIPSRPDYNTWIRIISAVGEVLPDADAIAVLSNWSSEEKPDEYQEKLKHRLKYVRYGSLVYLARRYGWKGKSQTTERQVPEKNNAMPSVGLITKRASEFSPRSIDWLWKDFIPYGHFTICEGDPGIGKSTVLIAEIPARLSKGESLYGDNRKREPEDVIVLSAEDDPQDTITPRLFAAGADMNHIHISTGVREKNGKTRSADLSRDIDWLREAIRRTKARLVIIDPLNAYLGSTIDSYKDASVRQVLSPLSLLAHETGAAIVGIRHWGKGSHGKAIHKGLGSMGYSAAARTVLQFANDPDDPESGNVVVAVGKSNLSRFPTSLTFKIVSCTVEIGKGKVIETSKAEWQGTCTHTANDLCTELSTSEQRAMRDEVMNFIVRELQDNGGEMPARQIQKTGQEIGFSSSSINRAKRKLGIESDKMGGVGNGKSQWVWKLPLHLNKGTNS